MLVYCDTPIRHTQAGGQPPIHAIIFLLLPINSLAAQQCTSKGREEGNAFLANNKHKQCKLCQK